MATASPNFPSASDTREGVRMTPKISSCFPGTGIIVQLIRMCGPAIDIETLLIQGCKRSNKESWFAILQCRIHCISKLKCSNESLCSNGRWWSLLVTAKWCLLLMCRQICLLSFLSAHRHQSMQSTDRFPVHTPSWDLLLAM